MRKLFNFFKNNSHLILLSLIVVSTIIWGLIQIEQPMIAEGDAYSRAMSSKAAFINKPIILKLNPWLPLHFIILDTANYFTIKNIYYTQRLITLILSSISTISLYAYTKEYFKKKNIALIAVVLYATLPIRMYLSTQTMSESMFLLFFITSLYFFLKLNTKNIYLFLIFINLSHAMRYESWLLLPLFFFAIVINRKLSNKQKTISILGSLLFPLGWLGINQYVYGNTYRFITEKYSIAQSGENEFYFNLSLTIQEWQEKLLQIFPISLLLISFTSIKDSTMRLNNRNIVFYLTPVCLYLSLIVQVYFGTMEWFPQRYLLLSTTLLLPIIANSLYILSKIFIKTIRTKKFVNQLIAYTLLLAALTFFFNEYIYIKDRTKHVLTTYSFLNSTEYVPRNINDSSFYHSFNNLKNHIINNHYNTITYYFSKSRWSWNDQALYYFTDTYGRSIPKDSYTKIPEDKKHIVVWEKDMIDKNEVLPENTIVTFENEHYLVLQK